MRDEEAAALKEQLEHINIVQTEVKEKVEAVHTALYDPDEGLFARIKQSNDDRRQQDNEIEKKLGEQVAELEVQLKMLEDWKDRTMTLARWVLGIWSTTTVGFVTKLIYDLFREHIKFI